MPTISVCYARGKEYGLNKRLDVILFNIVIAIKKYLLYILKGDIQQKGVTTKETISAIVLHQRRLFFVYNRPRKNIKRGREIEHREKLPLLSGRCLTNLLHRYN